MSVDPGDLGAPGGIWADLGMHPPAQGGLGVGAQERGSASMLISLGQRSCSFANSVSNGAVLKNVPPPVHLTGQSVLPVALNSCHGSSGSCAAPCQHSWALAATRIRPLPPSQARAAAIAGHTALCLERREKLCCLLWKAFTPPFVIADHTQRTIYASFSLIPTQTFFQG